MDDIREMSDGQVIDEYETLTRRIAAAIERREDLIEAMEAREIGDVRRLRGIKPVCAAVAAELGIDSPQMPDIMPRRGRDETHFWTNTKSIAAIVSLFLESAAHAHTCISNPCEGQCRCECGAVKIEGAWTKC